MSIRAIVLLAALWCCTSTTQAQDFNQGCSGYIDSLPTTLVKPGTWCLRRDLSAPAGGSLAALTILGADGQRIDERSATQIGPGQFVTVCEDIEAAMTLRLRVGGEDATAQLGARDRERNLCELRTQLALGQAVAMQAGLPQTGQRVFAVSNALVLGVGISEGVVAGVRQDAAGMLIQFTAAVSPWVREMKTGLAVAACSAA